MRLLSSQLHGIFGGCPSPRESRNNWHSGISHACHRQSNEQPFLSLWISTSFLWLRFGCFDIRHFYCLDPSSWRPRIHLVALAPPHMYEIFNACNMDCRRGFSFFFFAWASGERGARRAKVRPKLMSLFRRTGTAFADRICWHWVLRQATCAGFPCLFPESSIHHLASCVLHPLWLKAFVAAAVPLNMSLVFGPCVADLFTAGWAPKYNLSFWSNEFGKGSSQLEKCKAYFREPSPAKFECMQKCFFCGMEMPRKCHHNWQFKWPLLWASFPFLRWLVFLLCHLFFLFSPQKQNFLRSCQHFELSAFLRPLSILGVAGQ